MKRISIAVSAALGLAAMSFAPVEATKAVMERVAISPETRRQIRSTRQAGDRWYGSRPGWSVAEGKRRARKRRNQLRQKAR